MHIKTEKWKGIDARVMRVSDEDKKKDRWGSLYFTQDFWRMEGLMDVIIDGGKVIKDRTDA